MSIEELDKIIKKQREEYRRIIEQNSVDKSKKNGLTK